ncbi:enoyl-CoA hydratase [Peribacillus saganii]|uniref:Enoyl-CoA hydratase n=1 Tax=Peribacillus saganii TaxID=2303992 RepID=A0A372LRL9_9BACI|nr:enoyl-CoA hydratase [Peribacillus saganii]RFU70432.1 enoyl-CoA hydratase [Peribacillus saganii]
MDKLIEIHRYDEGISLLVLNRPQAANALSKQMLSELSAEIAKFRHDGSVRCLIITGAGDKAFCAGADLKERSGMNETEVRQAVAAIRDAINGVESLPQPVIAAINGAAFGGGLELALACDIRISAEHSRMGLTETSLGIIPGAGGTQRLPRLIGVSAAKALIFTAKRISAQEAEQLCITSRTVPADELLPAALELAREIVKNAPLALYAAKKAINNGMETDLATGLRIEEMCYETTIHSEDRKEGLQAFKEKRMPVYTGK